MTLVYLSPDARREQIIAAATKLARRNGLYNVRRDHIAVEAGMTKSLVSRYFSMAQVRAQVMRRAVDACDLKLIAQGLAHGDRIARGAPPNIKREAAATLMY